MAKEKTGKTVTIEQMYSPARRPQDQRATLIGLGLNKRHKTSTLDRHAGSARHDRQGRSSRPRRRIRNNGK